MRNSERYQLTRQLSENQLSRSWCAINRLTGQTCFVKNLAETPGVDRQTAISLLTRSFDLQKNIRCSGILTASAKAAGTSDICIEYPFADPDIWRSLTPDLFWSDFSGNLVQISVLVDLLHLLGLVHCDLKLENFQVRSTPGGTALRMIDLDFLAADGTPAGGTIMGSPEHIAPEINENGVITTSSDNFSLGKSLGIWLTHASSCAATASSLIPAPTQERLRSLVGLLTEGDYVQRPHHVLDALLRCEIIDESRFKTANKLLLALQLLSHFRTTRSKSLRNRGSISKFFLATNRVLGLHEELLNDIEQVYIQDRSGAFNLIKTILQNSDVRRYGAYWQVQISEDALDRTYCNLNRITGVYTDCESGDPQGHQVIAYLRECITRESAAEHYLKAYLLARRLSVHPGIQIDSEMVNDHPLLIELADLATRLDIDGSVVRYLQQSMSLLRKSSPYYQEAVVRLIMYHLSLARYEQAEEILNKADAESASGDLTEFTFERRRLRAFLISAKGELDRSEKELLELRKEAARLKSPMLLANIYGSLGTLQLRRGNFAEAEKLYAKGVEVAQSTSSESNLASLMLSFSSLWYEIGEFTNSIKFGKMTHEAIRKPADFQRCAGCYFTLLQCYIAIGDFTRAEYWIQRYLISISSGGNSSFASYYFVRGLLLKNQGAYREAMESFTYALELDNSKTPPRNRGKAYINLGEIAIMQGQHGAARSYFDEARRIFDLLGDKASIVELEYLQALNEYYDGSGSTVACLVSRLKALLDRDCRHYAAHCLFHILASGDDAGTRGAIDLCDSFLDFLTKSASPMYRGAGILGSAKASRSADRQILTGLKSAFTILNNSHNRHMSALAARAIGEEYARSGKDKLACKFFQQAQKQAQAIPNPRLASQLAEQFAAMKRADATQSALLESVHGISEILKSIASYDLALVQIVQYAVDQTGAERGVLLLGRDQASGLEVKASVNCDEQSLRDIQDFSRNAPGLAAREKQSLIVENALEDKRTRGYQSVVMHNILSIICVPVTLGDNLYGVLYLDHHTIPALFDENDIRYVSSLSNFLAIMLGTLYKFKAIDTRKKQLEQDLARLGASQSLITRNSTMLAMLSKIPDIARSSTPVLVVGENGTGKEVLCELIHSQSLRASQPLVKLNCAAIAGSLIESELFGVAKNVATGVGERDGKFSAADGGTLILDEIGDMPLEVQAKVLRALEYQKFEKVGSNRTITTDIRFLYATNKDLKALIRDGKFRQDLYYRISTIVIEIPPLRERPDDIELLINHFLQLFSSRDIPSISFSARAINALVAYEWPGNVRELRNLVEKYCILYAGRTVDLADLPQETRNQASWVGTVSRAEAVEKARITDALNKSNWNQSMAAKFLGVPLSTLRRKILKYKITREL
jgi:Nif-specific regulatory protein